MTNMPEHFLPKVPCVECGGVFITAVMDFRLEHGRAIHRCRACADNLGLFKEDSSEGDQKLFDELTDMSDPQAYAALIRHTFGPGLTGTHLMAKFVVNQLLVTAALKPGSPQIWRGIDHLHKALVAGAQDRRAEAQLEIQSDADVQRTLMALVAKAQTITDANSNPIPAILGGPVETVLGREAATTGISEGAGTEAAREPQPVGAAS